MTHAALECQGSQQAEKATKLQEESSNERVFLQ